MKRDTVIGLSVAAGLGAAIWVASPLVTGSPEPWDAESPYYIVSLCLAGAAFGVLYPQHAGLVFPGMVAGQLVYLLVFLPSGPLLPLGVLFLLGYGMLPFLAAVLASRVRHRYRGTGTGGS